jgi:hypothetical protein
LDPGLVEADRDVLRKCPDAAHKGAPAIDVRHAIVTLELEREAPRRVGREQWRNVDHWRPASALPHHVEHVDHGGQRDRFDPFLQLDRLPCPIVIVNRQQRNFVAEAPPLHGAAVDGRAGSVFRAPGR